MLHVMRVCTKRRDTTQEESPQRSTERKAFPGGAISNNRFCILGVAWALLPYTSVGACPSGAHVFGSAPLFDRRAQEEKKKNKNGTTE